MIFSRSLVLSAISALMLAGAARADSSYLDQGLAAYGEKRYYAAEDLFNKALQENPGNQSIHYFLGKTLEALCDPKSAREAYQNCFRINPFSVQGKYAKQSVTELSGRIEASKHVPSDTPEMTSKTIDMINRQANAAKARYGASGNTQAAWSLTKANTEVQRLGYQQRFDQSAFQGYRRSGNGNTVNMGDMSNMYAIRTNYIRTDGQVQANLAKTAATQAQAELQSSANNLEYLLSDKRRPGEPKLRALGTDLYVRYYGNEDHEAPTPPQDPIIEMKATQLRLSELPGVRIPDVPVHQQVAAKKAIQLNYDSSLFDNTKTVVH